jgi:hypothetical protein
VLSSMATNTMDGSTATGVVARMRQSYVFHSTERTKGGRAAASAMAAHVTPRSSAMAVRDEASGYRLQAAGLVGQRHDAHHRTPCRKTYRA